MNDLSGKITRMSNRFGKYSWVLLGLRILLGTVFLFAASGKFMAPHAFADSIGSFKIFHESILMAVGLIIIWHEIIAGLLILIGLWTQAAAAILAWMLANFFLGLSLALARGFSFDCGCFGAFLESGVSWISLSRTAILMFAAFFVFFAGGGRFSLDAWLAPKHKIPDAAREAPVC